MRKPQIKAVKVPGVTLSYTPSKSNTSIVDKVMASMRQKTAKREAREAERAANPPDLTPRACLVAFIDILGFGHEIERAKTKVEIEKIYKKVRLVQKEFGKDTAADDPDEQTMMNRDYGRRVLALSDAVVVAITSNCPATEAMGGYDFFGFTLFELLLAQARCAVAHGIFVRGGISHGSFFFEDDVLLSPALARAYELESKHAEYPLIVVPEATRRAILAVRKKGAYAPGFDPTLQYFARHGRRTWRGDPLYFLNYAPVMVNEQHRGMLPEDREDYRDAQKNRDYERVQAMINRSALKDAAFFLKWHRKRIEDAYTATASDRIRKKYRWLMNYHNRSFRNDLDYLRDEVIDLSKYQPIKA